VKIKGGEESLDTLERKKGTFSIFEKKGKAIWRRGALTVIPREGKKVRA